MPRQFMIKKWSPDKIYPLEETQKTETSRPYDLSTKAKLEEPEENIGPPVKMPIPIPGVIEFSPKIVSSNMSPSIGVAMINKDPAPNPFLKPSLESINFSSIPDVGANWQRSLCGPSFIPYPIPFIPRPTAEFSNPVQAPAWKGGLLGGSLLTPIPRLQLSRFLPETSSYSHIKDTNSWMAQNAESISPVSRPDSGESSKESTNSVFASVVSSSTGSPSVQPSRYICPDCNKSYATYSGLSRHKQFHCITIEKKSFNCKYCEKVYISLGALKMHIRTHTLPCKCNMCGKAFSRPWLLQGHIRTHTGEKPFSCPHCNRAFADRSNLRAHLQTHSDVKKYSCNACSKTFSRMSLLMKHNDGGCGSQQRSSAHYIPIGVRT